MIIKHPGEKQHDIDTLLELKARPSTSLATQRRIDQEIRNIKAGLRGEAEAAYEMNVLFNGANHAVLHDLRLSHNGIVAQIDHLLINRFLDMWVCESKHFSEGISINEQGEFCAFYGGKPYGVGSPISQNEKHILMLKRLIGDKRIVLPTRLGMEITPRFNSLILVSKGARIQRPRKSTVPLGSVIKNDMLAATYEEQTKDASVMKIVSSKTLEDFARSIAALHTPHQMNWEAKFATEPSTSPDESATVTNCSKCGAPVTAAVTQYCLKNKSRFHGKVYCQVHQHDVVPVRENTKHSPDNRCHVCTSTVSAAEALFCQKNPSRFNGKLFCRKHQ